MKTFAPQYAACSTCQSGSCPTCANGVCSLQAAGCSCCQGGVCTCAPGACNCCNACVTVKASDYGPGKHYVPGLVAGQAYCTRYADGTLSEVKTAGD